MTPRRSAIWIARLVLLLVWVASLPVEAQQGEPWQIPADQRAQLDSKYGSGYWYELYDAAVETLTSRRREPSRDDLVDALNRLRFAIAEQPKADQNRLNPQLRTRFEYFPYLYVSYALYRLSDYENAGRALARVDQAELNKAGTTLRQLHGELGGNITALRSAQLYTSAFDRLRELRGGGMGIQLSPDGQRAADAILAEEPDRQQRPTAERVENVYKPLLARVDGLFRSEMELRLERSAALELPAWRDRVASAALTEVRNACASPAPSDDPERIPELFRSFQQCLSRTDSLLRTAGREGCAELQARHGAAVEAVSLASRRNVTSAPAPEVPAVCRNDWNSIEAQDLGNAIAALEYGETLAAMDRAAQRARDALREQMAAQNRELAAVLDSIPTVPSGCASVLSLGEPAQRLGALRQRLDGAMTDPNASVDLTEARKEAESHTFALVERAGRGLERLVGEREACPDVEPARFEPLPGLKQSLDDRGTAGLAQACSAAREARQALDACYRKNHAVVVARSKGYAWFFDVAAGWNEATASGLDCLETHRQELSSRAARPRNNQTWRNEALGAIEAGGACLQRYNDERSRWTERLVAAVESGVSGTASLDPSRLGAQGARIEALRGEMGRGQSTLERLRPLLQAGEGLDEDGLRGLLQGAGLLNQVAPERWTTVRGLRGADLDRGLLALRDDIVDGVLIPLDASVRASGQQIGRWVAYQQLAETFALIRRGELEQAIVRLRPSLVEGRLGSGRPAALGHAALSYLLFLKWQGYAARADGDFAANVVRRESEEQAALARRADGTFQPPSSLFTHEGFRRFFRESG